MEIGNQVLLKRYDQTLIENGYTIETLIDKASDQLIKHLTMYKDLIFFVGSGNNGADALACAYKLKDKVKAIYYIGNIEKASKGNQYYYQLCKKEGLSIFHDYSLDEIDHLDGVIVDGLFGFGLNREIGEPYYSLIEHLNNLSAMKIAIDIPSGLSCDQFYIYGISFKAHLTISLTSLKESYIYPQSLNYTGKVVVETLDVDKDKCLSLYQLIKKEDLSKLIKDRKFDGYKNTYGKVLLIVGSKDYYGAAYLSSKACMHSGSGYVFIHSRKEVMHHLISQQPEIVPHYQLPINYESFQAVLFGSGVGINKQSEAQFHDLMKNCKQPIILDGDGITYLSKNLHYLETHKTPIIITPHIGEFKRLINESSTSYMDKVMDLTNKYSQLVVILKGPYTSVVSSNYACRIQAGNKAMSVAGMGDTLAGIVSSLIGQGYTIENACILAVGIHGLAGDYLAMNRYTVLPSELIKQIPMIMYDLLHHQI